MKSMTSDAEVAPAQAQSRWEERDARRKANAQVARDAAERRASRGRSVTIVDRVEKAKVKLNGTNVAGAIQLIQSVSPDFFGMNPFSERDIFIDGQRKKIGSLKNHANPFSQSDQIRFSVENV